MRAYLTSLSEARYALTRWKLLEHKFHGRIPIRLVKNQNGHTIRANDYFDSHSLVIEVYSINYLSC